jgi:hypothetical protein
MALAFETVYGTPPASGYTRMPFASTSLGSEQPLISSELLGYGRDPLAPIKDAVTADGAAVVPIDAEAFGFWLKAAFGDPVTSGTLDVRVPLRRLDAAVDVDRDGHAGSAAAMRCTRAACSTSSAGSCSARGSSPPRRRWWRRGRRWLRRPPPARPPSLP